MTQRQFANLPIDRLESLFDRKRDNADVLTSLLGELSHRKTGRAKALKERVLQALSVLGQDLPSKPSL
jgi:hypothetical protein